MTTAGSIVFSSEELPANLSEKGRFGLWREIYSQRFGEADISCLDLPFSSRSEFSQIGELGLVRCESTIQQFSRNRRQAASDGRHDYLIGFNRCAARMVVKQRGREAELVRGAMNVYMNAEPSECMCDGENAWIGLSVPLSRLAGAGLNADDLICSPVDAMRPAVRHLARYVEFLAASDELAEEPRIDASVETVLLDLVTLAFGANGEVSDVASGRGLRAARIREILAELRGGFADPGFSAARVGRKLGLTGRYVQELLYQTELSFTERVLELRLQSASAMLADPRHDRLKISDIAYACGFGEVSYFNRCFRRRFGCSPTQYRCGPGENDRA